MDIFLTVLGVFLGIILAIFVVIAILYFKLKSTIGTQNMNELKSVVSNISNLQKEEYVREKNVKGMTKLLEPEIMRDFPEFNKDLIFSMCESNLRKIFNAIESQDVTAINNDEEFIYLREKIDQQIEDMKSNNVIEKFDNIEFNRHAIMAYNKNNGKATIKISTTLGYYYKTNRTDKKSYENIKKQTRYTSEFVYVYNERRFTKNQVTFSVLCPNCGAPLRGLESKYCEYCGNHVERINLKIWKMSSYKEDY